MDSANPPTVSVLLPTYDRAAYLGAAVASVLGQTFRDLELIVVDDGSTDDSDRVLAGIGDPRLRVVRTPHAGCAAALNAGLATARGRYVARNDSDDVWLPDLLAELVPLLDARPGLGMAYARCEGMDAAGAPTGATRGGPLRYPEDAFRSLLYANYTPSIATVFRRSCLERVGVYDEGLTYAEDWDLALRVARHFPVVFADRVLARIREHPGNATALRPAILRRRARELAIVLDKAFAEPAPPARAARTKALAYRNHHIGTALQWLMLGEPREAGRALAAAFRVGGNPLRTLGRAALSGAVWFGLSRYRATSHLGYAVVGWRSAVRTTLGRSTSRIPGGA
jgi:glycosyltransferase involved in cell wall biosynthesis